MFDSNSSVPLLLLQLYLECKSIRVRIIQCCAWTLPFATFWVGRLTPRSGILQNPYGQVIFRELNRLALER